MHLKRLSSGQSVNLADSSLLGSGGEARIFRVSEGSGLAAKVYHRPTAAGAAKLEAMLVCRLKDANNPSTHRYLGVL